MTAVEWDASGDWTRMLGQMRSIDGSRKLRLWAVAVCRHILDRHARDPISPDEYDHWFDTLIGPIFPRLAAAEDYADGRISRRALHADHTGSGGPYNVFHSPLWHSRLTAAEIVPVFEEFQDEFG